jgi:hypothetical protein
VRTSALLVIAIASFAQNSVAGTIVFYEAGFPSVENGAISKLTLERALAPLAPLFVDHAGLQSAHVNDGDLIVLPVGSAVPVEAWAVIQRHLDRGNLLVIGGRPLFVPVHHAGPEWRIGNPQNTYSRYLGIMHTYSASGVVSTAVQWDDDAPWFRGVKISARRVFVNAGWGERYRGLGFLLDAEGNRIAAPVVADDIVGNGLPPRRRVFLSFDADSSYWQSNDGVELIRRAAVYASQGGDRLWLDLQKLSLAPGERVSGAVDLLATRTASTLRLELLNGTKTVATQTVPCGKALHEQITLPTPLHEPGLYRVRAALLARDTIVDQYTSGVFVRDPALLHSGPRLAAGRDYFTLDGKPYLMAGANYFSTDPYTSGFFVGGSLGGNAWVWDRDFAEMEKQGLTIVRTGVWLNRLAYLDRVSGAVDERVLSALEAFLTAAARHRMQVVFTFFAFDPQTVLQRGPGQNADQLGPGSNPYCDPAAIDAELAYVRAIVTRFRDIPFLSYDLINEPSFSNPQRLWKGNSPNNDPAERAAWQRWIENHYTSIDRLAESWRAPREELGGFDRVPLPGFSDLEVSRSGNLHTVRAVDYNRFAQDTFRQWVDTIIKGIRDAGSTQAVTVGQDEGGVADRLLNQFWGASSVNYTVNHTWWRDDALLWNSVAAKTPAKPNIVGETGPQPVWAMDGSSRWDDVQGMPLLERKLALGFANANAGVLHWDWTRSDDFGLMRRDGSHKTWMRVLSGIARFAHDAQPFATGALLPEIALVLPQSLQLSTFGNWGISIQQNAVRALYNHARATAFAVGEYQLATMPEARLIIVPASWILHQEAWDLIMARVQAGATVLISGRVDADEHWQPVPERTRGWDAGYSSAILATREVQLEWPDGSARLTYAGEKTTYAERGVLKDGKTYAEITFGKGKILYVAVPLEGADQLNEVGRVYRFAMKRAGVRDVYETSSVDPGLLICPTRLPDATLYVLTSESAADGSVAFRDIRSGKELSVHLAPGRAALLVVGKDGVVRASYNVQ